MIVGLSGRFFINGRSMPINVRAFAFSIPVCLAFSGAAAADDLTFKLINKTKGVLTHFYTSPVGVSDWEEDVFGDDVLGSGESVEITIADGRRSCKYDMKFTFDEESGLEEMTDTQDLCEMGTYTITD